jgi:phosphonate transport system substrate-binding protein
MEFLAARTGKRIMYYIVHSNSTEVEAMRAGRLHIAGFSPGTAWFAVNLAGYVPLAVKGYEKAFQGTRLIVIARADSPLRSLADLKGKKVAHTSPSSHSGHMAPLALFPKEGVTPGSDYRITFSGGQSKSIHGVNAGEYDAACVASDIFRRMADAGRIKSEDYKILWQCSGIFPTAAYGLAHDLHPDLAQTIKDAFFAYRFPPEMQKLFGGADRFFPITYRDEWASIALIAKAASGGETLDAAGLEKLRALEEAQARRAREAGAPAKK